VRLARRIAQQPSLAAFKPKEKLAADVEKMLPGDEADVTLAKTSATTIFHPVGTTKMGRATDTMVRTCIFVGTKCIDDFFAGRR
jgi:choline dehydrogenase